METDSLACLLRGNLSLKDFEWEPKLRPGVAFDLYDNSHLVPEIDLQPLFAPSSSSSSGGLEDLVQQLSSAARSCGFMQVYNHGVSRRALGVLQEYGRRFFESPLDEKMEMATRLGSLSSPENKYSTGYMCGNSSLSPNKWWCESLRVASADPLNIRTAASCLWLDPDDAHTFSKVLEECTKDLTKLAEKLTSLLFKGLGIDEDEASVKHLMEGGNDTAGLKWSHYPACPQPELTLGLPSHSDVSVLTILHQEDVSGLQLRLDGSWITVKPRCDALVVNVGDLFQVWSNDEYKSGYHRVVLNKSMSRYSIAYFHGSNGNTTLSPLPKLLESKPCKFRSISVSEYRKHTFSALYKGILEGVEYLRY